MTINPQAIQALFARAIEIADPTEREKFITEECGGDAKLYERVVNLLIAFDGSKGFLDQPTQAQAHPQLNNASQYQPGNMIAGRYKLLEAIGEGGMGTVWVAEQSQPVRRKVALKLVKPGMDSKQVLARFDAERQALALMDHPNIAKVFDGGVTDQGRPFFAMELVKGMPLTEYCDSMRLSVEERLKLFVPICQAVQHAHQKGIIHRDLKPSNVLICLYDGKPVPKVIDFGLAKAMHQPLTEQTVHTGFGLMIGTPLYMSPEQAEHNNLDVDTRSDVYSLGVMLYELLTGSTPLEKAQFKEAAFGEILRLIKEVEPPKPSTRVSASAQLPNIAAQRNLDPAQLGRSMRGDLDWIVMKALEKDRASRYETANGLARDIERFLKDEAVEACPPSTSYKLRKIYRKNRAAILTTTSFAFLLVLGAAGSTWQAVRAIQAERIALQAEANAKDEQKRAIENEQKAIEAQTAESKALAAESEARSAESEQRAQAELQRDNAQRLQNEALTRSAQLEKLTQEQRRSIYASEMNLVRLEAQNGNLPRMREILMNQLPIHGDEDLRGFEWNYWYRYLTQAKILRRFENFRYGEPDSAGAVLPGGEFVAITEGKQTRIMEIATGNVVQTIAEQLKILVNRTRFSENGDSVFGAASSIQAYGRSVNELHGSVRAGGFSVYGPSRKKLEFVYPTGSFSHVSQFSISEDGRFVAVIGNDTSHQPHLPATRLLAWNVLTQELIMNRVEKREWNRIELNQDGSRIAVYVAHSSRRYFNEPRDVVSVIDVAKNEELKTLQHDDEIDSLNWHPSKEQLILTTLGFSGRNQKELLTWNIKSDSAERLSNELIPNFVKIAMRPDGGEIAIASHGTSTIRLINTQNGQLVNTLHNEAATIESLTYSKDGNSLVALATSGEVVRWNLAQASDLFGLRAAAVKSEFGTLEWEAASGMERIAFADQVRGVWIRERDGTETSIKGESLDSAKTHMRFSEDGRMFALLLSKRNNRNTLVLYDAIKRMSLWECNVTGQIVSSGTLLCFSPDNSIALVNMKEQMHHFDVTSGKDLSKARVATEPDVRLGRWDFVSSVDSSRVWVGVTRSNLKEKKLECQVRDAITDEIVASLPVEFTPSDSLQFGGRIIVSPDGKKIAIASFNSLGIWDVRQRKQIFKLDGAFSMAPVCFFSRDGGKLVFGEWELAKRITTSSGSYRRISRVQILDIATRKVDCIISFSGDPADEVKLSPDGKRVLSLHGKNPLGAIDSTAKGKLWDADSGREILTLPVADRNLYRWDMFFDSGNQSLVALLFNKANGNLKQGYSHAFDGTPIPKHQDDRLVAEHLVQYHSQNTSVPFEIGSLIQSNAKLGENVRKIALEIVQKLPFDSSKISMDCLEIVQFPMLSADKYEQALGWARALYAADPESLRTRSLMGAALFRTGRIQEAYEIVKSRGRIAEMKTLEDLNDEVLRRSIEILCQDRLEERIVTHRSAVALADFVHDYQLRNPNSTLSWPVPSGEALNTQGNEFVTEQVQARPRISKPKPASDTKDHAKFAEFPNMSFQKGDANRDGKISPNELPGATWKRFAEYDTDLDEQLDLVEFKTGMILMTAIESTKSSGSVQIFVRTDRNGNGLVSPEEAGEVLWSYLRLFDKDKDNLIDASEFELFTRKNAFLQKLSPILTNFEPEIQVRVLNHALALYADEPNLLNARAWVLSTAMDEKLRDGKQAVIDATKSCEDTRWSVPGRIETLAAAHAEAGDFSKAIEFQKKAIAMSGTPGTMYKRLELYESQKPYRESEEDRILETAAPITTESPLISSVQFESAKRIRGGQPCFSADGQQLLYALTAFGASTSYFELLDLTTGSTKILAEGGVHPVWSHGPDRKIAVQRHDKDKAEIWLLSPQGQYEKKVADGANLNWSADGKLFYLPIVTVPPMKLSWLDPDSSIQANTAIQGNFTNLAVSKDGNRVAFSKFNKWHIGPIDSPQEAASGYTNYTDLGTSDWSYDGKYIVFGCSSPNSPGIWLIEANTGKRRLLVADVLAMPRWAPDGKTIAAGLLTSNEVVLLDLSSLDLAKAFASE